MVGRHRGDIARLAREGAQATEFVLVDPPHVPPAVAISPPPAAMLSPAGVCVHRAGAGVRREDRDAERADEYLPHEPRHRGGALRRLARDLAYVASHGSAETVARLPRPG